MLTVGARELDAEAQRGIAQASSGGKAEPLFIKGEWGSGKTHSLAYIRSALDARGLATSSLVLDARTTAPSHPQRLHPLFARELALRGNHGLRKIFLALFEDPGRLRRAIAEVEDKATADVSQALRNILDLAEARETIRFGSHHGWRTLTGSDIAGSDYAYRREKALCRIAWIAGILGRTGAPGLGLFLDELETIDQLWNRRSRGVAYETLGRLVAMPRTWCVFGVTERFLRVIYDDARSEVYAYAGPNARAFLRPWRHGEARIVLPPVPTPAGARQLSERVVELYHEAYPDLVGHEEAVELALSTGAINPRRLVRGIIDACDRARHLAGT